MLPTLALRIGYVLERGFCSPALFHLLKHPHHTSSTIFAPVAFNKLRTDVHRKQAAVNNRDTKVAQKKHKDLLIECKRSEFDLPLNGDNNNSNSNSKLASAGWLNRKSNGDFFTIHPTQKMTIDYSGSFENMNLHPQVAAWLQNHKIKHPTEIQSEAMEPMLNGHNVLLAAETGCGKTLAYLLPLMHQLHDWNQHMQDRDFNAPLGLDIAKSIGSEMDLNTKVVLGGGIKTKMMNFKFEKTELVFQFQCNRVPGRAPIGTQLTLVSATMPKDIGPILDKIVDEESVVKITTSGLHQLLPSITQKFQRIGGIHKPAELLKIAKTASANATPLLIFSNKSSTSDWISMFLNESEVHCVNLNAEMHRIIRRGKFQQFQDGMVYVLSTTDVGSRGLDTTRAQIVLNYDFPTNIADYIHRCGRIGRVSSDSAGKVINFVCGPQEAKLVQVIEEASRNNQPLPNVNANITRIIENRATHRINRAMKMQL
ncbi:hypothetical protein B566_EDAN001277 [Ephemera danica]|nr:hypothetical protein B566_EDAN001277 [Ephemera danica]